LELFANKTTPADTSKIDFHRKLEEGDMNGTEQAIIGWAAIARMFNCSERKIMSLRPELPPAEQFFI